MGKLYKFVCTDCALSATASGGADNHNRHTVTGTFFCNGCNQLVEALTHFWPYHKPRSPDELSRALKAAASVEERQRILAGAAYSDRMCEPEEVDELNASKGRCPRCGSRDLRPWKDGEPCPSCGGKIDRYGYILTD